LAGAGARFHEEGDGFGPTFDFARFDTARPIAHGLCGDGFQEFREQVEAAGAVAWVQAVAEGE